MTMMKLDCLKNICRTIENVNMKCRYGLGCYA